jgi:molybdenum cofactor cytidylyltransferase
LRARVIAGILLAAGSASRFGADKLLSPLPDGTPVVVQAARRLRSAVPDAWVVLRPEQEALAGLLLTEGLKVVSCPQAVLGMGESLACGVRATATADGWVVALGDMPFVRPETARAVAERIAAGVLLAAPKFRGRRGHPVGFGREFGARLSSLSGDVGARAVLEQEKERLALIAVDDPGVLLDIDTPGDLAALVKGEGLGG